MTKKVLFMLAMLTCIFASCSDGGSDDPVNPTPKPEEVKAEITLDSTIESNGLSFGASAGDNSVSFTTNTNWTLTVSSTTSGTVWCTASAISGSKGSATVKFTVTENTEYDDRSVSVTVKAGTASKTFKVTQKGVDALLVTTSSYEVAQKGGSIEVEVKANIDYQLEISETAKGWITEAKSKSRALKATNHKFDIALNEEAEKREGEIIFKSGDKVETVKVYQAGGALIMLTQNELTISDAGDIISVEIKSNVEFGVQMPEVDWITDEASSRGMSSHTLKYVIAPNEGYDNRTAEIIFYDKNSDLTDTLKVVQAQKDAIVISKKEYELTIEGGTLDFEVSSNIDFSVELSVDWIKQVSYSKGLESKQLHFIVDANTTGKEREGNITFVYGDLKQIVNVVQSFNIPYVAFTAEAPQKLTMSRAVDNLEYSVDDGEWNLLDTTPISFGGNIGVLRLRGKSVIGTAIGSGPYDYSWIKFENDTPVYCSGDIRTLIDYENYTSANTENARFCNLFSGCSALVSAPKLPAITLADECYYCMFGGCRNLTTAPELPATELAKGCYSMMFEGCTNLTTAPELPATTLAERCYENMFTSCSNLVTAPELPATTLAKSCYIGMFQSCEKLITAPKLPATTLAEDCYSWMFNSCDNLTVAPELPATTLARGCYSWMFHGCRNLTTPPALPATILAAGCYLNMFMYCDSLVYAPELPAKTLENSCYAMMFYWCKKLSKITMLAVDVSAENCLYNWVVNIAENGTFVKDSSMMDLPSSNSGIPIGWLVENKE